MGILVVPKHAVYVLQFFSADLQPILFTEETICTRHLVNCSCKVNYVFKWRAADFIKFNNSVVSTPPPTFDSAVQKVEIEDTRM
jgi:hypothetical protein